MQSGVGVTRSASGGFWFRGARYARGFAVALAVWLLPPLAPAAEGPATPAGDDGGTLRPARATERRSVLVLSGMQYGLPVADAVIAGAVAALKGKGVSANDIYVESLDIVRHPDARRRAALAAMLRDKLASRQVAVVIATNQSGLDFLTQEGSQLAPPDVPVVAAFRTSATVEWRGAPRPIFDMSDRADVLGTIRHGLALFPRTRRLVIVFGADDRQLPTSAQAVEALASLPVKLEVEDTAALTHEEMLQRVAALPADTLVLLGAYFGDRTGRSFVPAEVAAEIAGRANAPVLALYDAHIREGLLGGAVVTSVAAGERAGEIGFQLLRGARLAGLSASDAVLRPQPLFDWSQVERWGGDPAKPPPTRCS